MRGWIFGIVALLLWSAGSTYWYVCKIKGACGDAQQTVQVILPNQASTSSNPATVYDLDVQPKAQAEPVDLDSSTQNALPEEADEAVERNVGTTNVSPRNLRESHIVLFAFAKPLPENRTAFDAYIEDLSAELKAHPNKKVLLQGYTDDTAARENNLKLAMRRCNVIADLLVSKGVPETQIQKEALGEADPVATNDTQAGRRLNRRVVISIQE